MRTMLAVAAIAVLGLGGCAMDGERRSFVQGINDTTAATPIPEAGMWRLSNGLTVPMGYAPAQVAQDQLVLNSVTMRPAAPGIVR